MFGHKNSARNNDRLLHNRIPADLTLAIESLQLLNATELDATAGGVDFPKYKPSLTANSQTSKPLVLANS